MGGKCLGEAGSQRWVLNTVVAEITSSHCPDSILFEDRVHECLWNMDWMTGILVIIYFPKYLMLCMEEAAQYVLSSRPMEKIFSVSIQVISPSSNTIRIWRRTATFLSSEIVYTWEWGQSHYSKRKLFRVRAQFQCGAFYDPLKTRKG